MHPASGVHHVLNRRSFSMLAALSGLGPVTAARAAPDQLIVFAASSLKNILDEIAFMFRSETGAGVAVSVAGSGQLAKQIEAGAPADVFISADEIWMSWLAERGLIKAGTRRDIASNALVLIAPQSSALVLEPRAGFGLKDTLGDGKLAMGAPDTVPAGRYAKQALTKLGVWDSVSASIAATENVRAALLLVSRGEALLGIVFASDAKSDPSVRVVGQFPADSHDRILYPAAVTSASAHPLAEAFVTFLASGKARDVMSRAGFILPNVG